MEIQPVGQTVEAIQRRINGKDGFHYPPFPLVKKENEEPRVKPFDRAEAIRIAENARKERHERFMSYIFRHITEASKKGYFEVEVNPTVYDVSYKEEDADMLFKALSDDHKFTVSSSGFVITISWWNTTNV